MKRLVFMLSIVAMVVGFIAMGYSTPENDPRLVAVEEWAPVSLGSCVAPTELSPPEFSEEEVAEIASLAAGIRMWHDKWNQGFWWECGVLVEESDFAHRSNEWATEIYRSVKSASSGSDLLFSYWGVAGTIARESNYDPCALGTYPRNKAYELGLLKRNKRTISHSREDILRVMSDSNMQQWFSKTGMDVGVCQILTRYWPDEYSDSDMLDMTTAIRFCATEMSRRAQAWKTKRPWAYWRGYYVKRYDDAIVKSSKMMGFPSL